jgi:hypothetical protein
MCGSNFFSLSIDLKMNHNAKSDLGQVIVLIMNHLLRAIHGLLTSEI